MDFEFDLKKSDSNKKKHGIDFIEAQELWNNLDLLEIPAKHVVQITEWSAKEARIKTNVEIYPSSDNGLYKKSVADCLQTRPIDHRHRLVKILGRLSIDKVQEINQSLRVVFELNA